MSKNKVKQVRTQQKLSQRELAKLAGTSQQQIQRIEAGKITTSLETAKAICAALGKPMELVFPDAARALKELRDEMGRTRFISDTALAKVSEAGVEADPWAWYFKVYLNGRQEPFLFPISGSEKRRLYSAVQKEGDGVLTFVVFDSATDRVAINLSEVGCCHFLREPGSFLSNEDSKPENTLRLTPVGGMPTIELGVDEDEPEDEDGIGQVGHVLFMLELSVDASDRYRIIDQDGEDAFLRAGNISMLQSPLWVIGEGERQDDETDDD